MNLSFQELKNDVIDRSICFHCGGCEASCPVNVIKIDEDPKLIGKCIKCGNCYEICPATEPKKEKNKIKDFFSVKTTDKEIKVKAQNGGAVSTVLKKLFEKNKIDSALVVMDEDWDPIPEIITEKEEVIKSSGTKYGYVSLLKKTKEASEKGRTALVGTPCHVEAAWALKDKGIVDFSYIISLFCMKNLDHDCLMKEIQKNGIKEKNIKKMGIDKGEFFVEYGEGKLVLELEELDNCFKEPCEHCQDFDGKYSDISVGSVGSENDFSTVLVRTEKGEEAIELANEELNKKDLDDIDFIKKLDEIKNN